MLHLICSIPVVNYECLQGIKEHFSAVHRLHIVVVVSTELIVDTGQQQITSGRVMGNQH